MVNKVNELLNEHEKIQLELKFYFDDVNFSNIFLDEFISEVLEKEFYFWSTEVEGDKYAEFWSYFSGDKIDNEDYKIIRKFFLNKELKIKTADLNKDEIIESIKKIYCIICCFLKTDLNMMNLILLIELSKGC